ncbi:unnamed protein product [Diamesa serratosioi]
MGFVQCVTLVSNFDKKLDEIIDYLMIGSTYVYGYFIIVYFQLRYKKLQRLMDFAKRNFKKRSAIGLSYVTNNESFEISHKYCVYWVLSCVIGCLSWTILPLLSYKKVLPLYSWYPFDTQSSPNFEITYFLQTCGQIFVGVAYGIWSGVYLTMVIMICGQFDILFASLKNIGYTALLSDKTGRDKLLNVQRHLEVVDEEINQYYISTEKHEENDHIKSSTKNESNHKDINNKDELCNALADCIRHHTTILEFARMFKSFYSVYLFCKLFHATFLICFLAYTASIMEASPIKITNVFAYFSLATGELLLLCYYAEQLKRHSARAGEALMRSNWQTFVGPVQRCMIILLSNATKPIVLSAGNIYNLDIEQFRTVMSTAFSYYTLLKNLQGKIQ